MRLLDLFCGAGGCSVGYHRAGFTEIVGVDNQPMPRYPFKFYQCDAFEFIKELAGYHFGDFDAIHASPPCQRYSRLFTTMEHKRSAEPDLLGKTREALRRTGLPYVIENVHGAPLNRGSVMLCGGMFGLRTYRHRWFETPFLIMQPWHPRHHIKSDKGSRRKEYFEKGGFISVVGNVGVYCGPAAMGIDWMTGDELSQAIPPAYTEFIGKQLLRVL